MRALTGRVLSGMSSTEAADIARAEDLLGQALAISPDTALAHFAKANVLRAKRRYADAILEYETVIALDRNSGEIVCQSRAMQTVHWVIS